VTVIDPGDFAPNRLRPLRRSEYDRLVQLGCFEDEKIELLAGFLVEMSPQGTGHAHAIRKLTVIFVRGVGDRAIVQIQLPIGLSEDSEPEPDLSIVPNAEYRDDHPTRALLIVEVAQSSLRKDRRLKGRLYARAGIPEYWIVNVAKRVIEVHREPTEAGYASVTSHAPGEILRPQAFADVEVSVAELFLPAE
jgi:Uma2 family endonuclease